MTTAPVTPGGKTNVAPYIATTRWAPMPTVLPQESRSAGATTSPGARPRPSPCSFHPIAMAALQRVDAGNLDRHLRLDIVENCQTARSAVVTLDTPHPQDVKREREVEPQVRVLGA